MYPMEKDGRREVIELRRCGLSEHGLVEEYKNSHAKWNINTTDASCVKKTKRVMYERVGRNRRVECVRRSGV